MNSVLRKHNLRYLNRYNQTETQTRLKTYFNFMIVRHTLVRVLSSYRDKLVNPKTHWHHRTILFVLKNNTVICWRASPIITPLLSNRWCIISSTMVHTTITGFQSRFFAIRAKFPTTTSLGLRRVIWITSICSRSLRTSRVRRNVCQNQLQRTKDRQMLTSSESTTKQFP